MTGSGRLKEIIRANAFQPESDDEAAFLTKSIVDRCGESVEGVVFFGSRKTKAGPDPWSGYDLFVLTRDYRSFYGSLRAAGSLKRSPLLVGGLNALLPPNQISLHGARGDSPPLAKCAVISKAAFLREASPRRRDHFCAGRLFQPTEVLYARNQEVAAEILDALTNAHVSTLGWVRPWLPGEFDAKTYSRVLLRVSLGKEIRPEPRTRADALWEAQRDYLDAAYTVLLEDLCQAGELKEVGRATYALARPVSLAERVSVEAYFRWSMLRATTRWFKYIVTFDDWLEYIVHKAERHTGETVVLTPRERALPVVFLWPRLVRYLRRLKR